MDEMNGIKVLDKKEKAEIESQLKEQFGILNIPGEIFMRGEERFFLFSGNLNENGIKPLEEVVFIERIGIYFAKKEKDRKEIRLSMDGVQALQNEITKNIFEIPDEMVEQWMSGRELNIKTGMKGFIIIKNKNDFLGCGKASEEKIGNFIPKNRRLKEKS